MPIITSPTAASSLDNLSKFERSVKHRFAINDGVRIHYAAAGSGQLLVLLHGFPDHWLGWWKVMDTLRSGYRVVALDMRGYNLSDKPSDTAAYSIAKLVGDVHAVIRNEGEVNATIIGHDWGGFVAWHAAMDLPEIVNRLIVLNMPHPWAISRELATNADQRRASEYVRFFRQPTSQEQFPIERLSAWVKDPAYKTRHDEAMARSSLRGMLDYYRANWPVEPYVERSEPPNRVKVPTLLVHGLADIYALPAGLNDVWSWIDNDVVIHTIANSGHFLQQDKPDRVASIITTWLAQ